MTMPADRPQRAEHTEREIEAVARALRDWHWDESGDFNRAAVDVIRRLDRARDARSDEDYGEVVSHHPEGPDQIVSPPRDARSDDEGQSFVCDGCGERLPGDIAIEHYCRSLQGEDHEAGIEAGIEAWQELTGWRADRLRFEPALRRAIAAYLSRVPPARDARSDEDYGEIVNHHPEGPDQIVSLQDEDHEAGSACRVHGDRATVVPHVCTCPPSRDARSDTLAVEKIANWLERDRREPDKVLCHVQSLRRLALAEFGGRAATDDQA